jgi:hypothetical protein
MQWLCGAIVWLSHKGLEEGDVAAESIMIGEVAKRLRRLCRCTRDQDDSWIWIDDGF